MTAVRTVKVVLEGSATGLLGTLTTTGAAIKGLGKELDVLAVKHEAAFKKITNVGLGVGVALVGAFALAEKSAMGFDKEMSAVNAVLDTTNLTAKQSAAQLSSLRTEAIQAGRDTAFTATQAAQAEEELAKAGIATADILSGGLSGALSLASAGSLDLADAAKFASQAMIEFNLHGKDMAHIADVLTAGANKSVTDVQGLGDALGQTGTVAHQAGMSLDETVGVLALFSQHGLDGVEAGTTFKQMLLKLEGPSGKAAAEMKQLGINVYDANGNFLSAAGIAEQLRKSLGGLTEQQRNFALATIFGSRAVRGAIDLYNAGASGVNDWTKAVGESGLAQETANKKLDNLAGDVKKFEGSLQALAITSTGSATTGLRVLAQGAEGAVNWFSKLPVPVQSSASVLIAVSGASLIAAAGFLKVRGTVLNLLSTLSDMGPGGARAAGAIGKIGGAVGKLSLIGAAAVGIYEGLRVLYDFLKVKTPSVKVDIDALTLSLEAFAQSGKVTGELNKTIGKNFGTFASNLAVATADLALAQANFNALKANQYTDDSVPNSAGDQAAIAKYKLMQQQRQFASTLGPELAGLDQSMANLVANGNQTAALTGFEAMTKGLQAQGWTLDQVNAKFPLYLQALLNAAVGNSGLAKGFADTNTNASLMAGSLQAAVDKLSSLDAVFKAINGGRIGVTEANIAFEQSLADLNKTLAGNIKALHGSKNALDIHTQAGRDDTTAILSSVKAAEAAAQAKYDETGSVDDANTVYATYIGNLHDALRALNMTEPQVNALLAAYAKMPPLVPTTLTQPGMDVALANAHTLMTYYSKLDGKTVKTTVLTHYGTSTIIGTGQQFNRYGGLYEHAAVGVLRDAHIAPAVGRGARYAYAEPQTHGEAFVPRSGNYGRSMSILSAAAGWYNASVVPGGRQDIHLHVTADAGAARALVGQLKFTISNMGGVTRALGP